MSTLPASLPLDLPPLVLPASLPAPPAPTGEASFERRLTLAADRQRGNTERPADGDWKRLELRRDEPGREATPQSPERPAVPASEAPPQTTPTSTTLASPAPEKGVPLAVEPEVVDAGTTIEQLVDALPLIALPPNPTSPPASSQTWQPPTLAELFPEYFPATDALVATAEVAPDLPTTAPETAGVGLTPLNAKPADASEPVAPQIIMTPRERRYGLGLGKPFQGHAAVNRRHIDRFGRAIPLPQGIAVQVASVPPQIAKVAPPATLPEPVAKVQADTLADIVEPQPVLVRPVLKNQPQGAPDLPADVPTFGQQVAYRPQAAHLRASTPGFAPPPVESQAPVQELTVPADAKADFAIVKPSLLPSDRTMGPDTPTSPVPEAPTQPINGVNAAILSSPGPRAAIEHVPARETSAAVRDVAAELTARITQESVPEGSSKLRVTLRPRELGVITIELTRHGDQLQTRIVTRTHEAQALFERMLPDLRVQLEERGFTVRSLDLSQQQQLGADQSGQHGRDWARPHSGWERPPLPQPFAEVAPEDAGDLDLGEVAAGLNLTV